ncbi:hypothetical protein RAZWK3B_16240 [Roseobacter sp. AzwK-3b]|nr:hypothetical protein RAZWK3B_16240 [Roseobacter sp. AzwK-3b]
MELISRSPLVEAVEMMGPEEIGKMFDQKGTGGATLLGKVPLEIVIEYAAEEARETTDFSSLFSRAVSDPYIYDALDGLVKDDAKRPGPPNKSLLDWMACRPDKRPSAKTGKRAQLKWRDALLVWLLNDARTLGFPVEGGRFLKKSKVVTAREVVREVVNRFLGMEVSERQLLRIWENNKERIPELYRQ